MRHTIKVQLTIRFDAAACPALTGRNNVHDREKVQAYACAAEEVARRVRESFVPLLRGLPGFREDYLFEGEPDVLISI
jgi:hypothetical protein